MTRGVTPDAAQGGSGMTTTKAWLLGGVLVTAVTEGHESAVTLTVTTSAAITDARTALAALAAEIQRAALERREADALRIWG